MIKGFNFVILLSLFCISTSSASDTFYFRGDTRGGRITISLKDSSILASRLMETISTSSFFEEVTNVYIEPGTTYRSKDRKIKVVKGNHLLLQNTRLTIGINSKDIRSFGQNRLSFSGENAKLLLETMLIKSKSLDYIRNKDHFGKNLSISSSTTGNLQSFKRPYISCSENLRKNEVNCEITLKR